MAKLKTGMRKRPCGGYEYRFYVKGKRYSVGGQTTIECRKKAMEKTAKIEAGLITDNDRLTLNKYFEDWIKQKGRNVKDATILVYVKAYKKYVASTLGKHRVVSLQRRQVMAMLGRIADTNSAYMANHVRKLLVNILNGAMRDEIIPRNVAASIQSFKDSKPPARETIHRELSERELKDFFSLVKGSIHYNAYRFMLYTGVRVGECLALQWRDVDFSKRLIHIRKTVTRDRDGKWVLGDSPKTEKSKRDIPINEAIRHVLCGQLENQRELFGDIKLCGFVFPNEMGKMGSSTSLGSCIQGALKKGKRMTPKVEIRPFSIHAFRDTFASQAIRAGIPPNTLKEIMGHASLAMTMDLYAHVSQQDKRKGMEKMLAMNFQ